jgi:hypothetical protein
VENTTQEPALWACPECGKLFWQANASHSCGLHTVDEFLKGKSPTALAYWERLRAMVDLCGPNTLVANKTNIGFMVLVRFVGVTALSDRGMTMNFWLKEEVNSSRFAKVEYLLHRDWLYRLRITSLDQMDDELQGWLCRSYVVGCRQA